MTQSRHIFIAQFAAEPPRTRRGLRRNLNIAAGASGARRCGDPQKASTLDVLSASASASAHAAAP